MIKGNYGNKYNLVVCVGDSLTQGLPVGVIGVIVEVTDSVSLKYRVNFPDVGLFCWCSGRDLMDYRSYVRSRASKELIYAQHSFYDKEGTRDIAQGIYEMRHHELNYFEYYEYLHKEAKQNRPKPEHIDDSTSWDMED